MNLSSLKYSREHEWVGIDNRGTALLGITEFAVSQLDDIVFVELPDIGSSLVQFSQFGEIESVKAVSELYSPISGEVIERNEAVVDNPELVNNNPYESGWLLKVKLEDSSEIENLMTHEQYSKFVASQMG